MNYIRRNRGLVIPPGPVMVNPFHPLASRMRSLILFDSVSPIDQIGQLGRFSKVGPGSISIKTSQYGRYLDCVNAGVRSAWPLGLTYWSDADWPRRRYTTVIVGIQTVPANNSSEDAKAPVLIDTTGYYEGGFGLMMGNTYGSASMWFPMEPSGASPGTIQQTWFVDGGPMPGSAGQVEINKAYGLAVKSVGFFNNGFVNFGIRRYNGNYSMQGGGPLLCYILEGDLPDAVLQNLTLNPTEPLLFPEDLLAGWPGVQISSSLFAISDLTLASIALGDASMALAGSSTRIFVPIFSGSISAAIAGSSGVALGAQAGAATGVLSLPAGTAISLGGVAGTSSGALTLTGGAGANLIGTGSFVASVGSLGGSSLTQQLTAVTAGGFEMTAASQFAFGVAHVTGAVLDSVSLTDCVLTTAQMSSADLGLDVTSYEVLTGSGFAQVGTTLSGMSDVLLSISGIALAYFVNINLPLAGGSIRVIQVLSELRRVKVPEEASRRLILDPEDRLVVVQVE